MSIEINRWKVLGGVNEKNLLENGIPSHLRHQVQIQLISGTLYRVPFMKQMSKGIIHSLAGLAKLEVKQNMKQTNDKNSENVMLLLSTYLFSFPFL